MKGAVAARQCLFQRGMNIDPICPMCGSENETILHMLALCPEAKRIWYLSPLRLEVEKYEGVGFGEWCGSIRVLHKDPHWWNILFAILWGIWLRRNVWSYENRKKDLMDVIQKAVSVVGDYEQAQQALSSSEGRHQLLESKWKPPTQGMIKINSDAAIFDNSAVGLGGVMRDALGEVVVATCLCLRSKYEVDVAEALALRHSLRIALESEFRKVCLETDCMKVFSHLTKGCAPATILGMVINDIMQLARGCQSCSFSFVKRSGNGAAHALAKLSSSYGDLRVWMEEVPSEISPFVMADLASAFE
ncbi:uncharacterized protein LOC110684687 [Chenopodium quinoa]|uniref:uncharacterized protein LOC110684687 n=1 Tax=Chenopodium quinoa TaxID=63459 RepID=UPI000B77C4F7|nr:uncharacterized protein LOC110684687 [Chenopodium quinoa]